MDLVTMDGVIQGTKAAFDTEFRDPDTNLPADPTDVVVTIVPPRLARSVIRFSNSEITRLDVGKYRFSIDTGPIHGQWQFEVDGQGPAGRVWRGILPVYPRL